MIYNQWYVSLESKELNKQTPLRVKRLSANVVLWRDENNEKLEQVIGKEKVTIELLPGTDHGGPNYETEQNINKVFVFLDKTIKTSK